MSAKAGDLTFCDTNIRAELAVGVTESAVHLSWRHVDLIVLDIELGEQLILGATAKVTEVLFARPESNHDDVECCCFTGLGDDSVSKHRES